MMVKKEVQSCSTFFIPFFCFLFIIIGMTFDSIVMLHQVAQASARVLFYKIKLLLGLYFLAFLFRIISINIIQRRIIIEWCLSVRLKKKHNNRQR